MGFVIVSSGMSPCWDQKEGSKKQKKQSLLASYLGILLLGLGGAVENARDGTVRRAKNCMGDGFSNGCSRLEYLGPLLLINSPWVVKIARHEGNKNTVLENDQQTFFFFCH